MPTSQDIADILTRKLSTRGALDDRDRAAIGALPFSFRELLAGAYLVRERQRPVRCAFIVAGFAFRQKLASSGGRQIVGFLIPGDFTDLQQLFLTQTDHNIQALTRMSVAEIPVDALREIALDRPAIAKALWTDLTIEGSITREQVLNIGRRDATERIAHLLCEFEARLEPAGLADQGYELPMTQEQLGDATGLTPVHVNRTLKLLNAEGLISRKGRYVKIEDWKALSARGDFDPLYLHLDQASPAG